MLRNLALVLLSVLSMNLAAAEYDVIVYGSTGAGICAAVQASRMGSSVLLLSPTEHIGGVSASGLGATDINRRDAIGGISREFYQRIYDYYLTDSAWKNGYGWDDYARRLGKSFWKGRDVLMEMQWMFEPQVAEKIFSEMLAETSVKILFDRRLDPDDGVEMRDGRISAVRMESGEVYSGRMFIDATYEGDLMASAGVSYTVGREPNSMYGETMNGFLPAGRLHKSAACVDPYIVEGDPSSGLLPFVDGLSDKQKGDSDDRIQAYCYRFTLSDDPENRKEIEKPERYEPLWYEHILRWLKANPEAGLRNVLTLTPIPNGKTDTNHADFIGANYSYPNGSYRTRDSIALMHRDYVLGLMWFLANDVRVPEKVRDDMKKWGLALDEFQDNGNFPYQLYVREARRMVGGYVMTEADVTGQRKAPESVGLGTYWFDSHVVSRYADPETGIHDEGCFWADESVYPISYRAICPEKEQCRNLLVPVCLSASHAAYGSIRMEPVYMVLGQSAAIAAVLSAEKDCPVQDLDYERLEKALLEYGQIIYSPDEAHGYPFEVSAAIQDNMVVQQGKDFTVWGRGRVGAKVKVSASWDKTARYAVVNENGQWECRIPVPEISAGYVEPQTLDVACQGETIRFDNILLGEVWFLSGQSNMEMTMQPSEPWHHGVENWKEEVAHADVPWLRFITSERVQADSPQFRATGKWSVCTPETAGPLAGVGYYFARRLIDSLAVPVGLVITSHGSMSAQMYTPNEVLASSPVLNSRYLQPALKDPGSVLETNRTEKLYNGMIYPYGKLSIRGILWYQGESNAGEYDTYHILLSKMTGCWRKLFGQGTLPFYYVQVAPYSWREEDAPAPTAADFYRDDYAFFRETQTVMRDIVPASDMVVTMDVGEVQMAHYPKKKPVGERLAGLALANEYGKDVECHSPRYRSFEVLPGKAVVRFDCTYGGLRTSDGKYPKHFYVAGKDRVFHSAYAEVDGDEVILHCPDVREPVAVRYAFLNFPITNLENSASLPAEPFRTDNWPPGSVTYVPSRVNPGLEEPQPDETLPESRSAGKPGACLFRSGSAEKSPVEESLENGCLNEWKLASDSMVKGAAGDIHSPGYDTSGWYDAEVPGTVLSNLVREGVFPDPYYGLNNLSIPDSLCRTAWWYRCVFDIPEDKDFQTASLLFNGINYRADVWLNGYGLGSMAGAFCRGDFDLEECLDRSEKNVLVVKIYPPEHPGIPHEQSMAAGMGPNGGQLCLDGPTFISSEGWDWVPGIRDRNMGIWQNVELRLSGDAVLKDYHIVTDLPLPDCSTADITFSTEVYNASVSGCDAEVRFSFDGLVLSKKVRLEGKSLQEVTFSPEEFPGLKKKDPELWWPNGYGTPYLYDADVSVYIDGKESDRKSFRFGIRELSYDLTVCDADGDFIDINFNPTDAYPSDGPLFDFIGNVRYGGSAVGVPRLLADEDAPGISRSENSCAPYLVLRVNGQRIFIRGGNWGMDDAMKRVSEQRLEPYIRMHKEQGFNMIRNWTGESAEEVFYSLCDKYGILVFNDFPMSTLGYNLAPDDFRLMAENVGEIVKRYRNHPSIAVWCPRNEGFAPVALEPEFARIISETDGTRHYSGTSINVNLTSSGPWGLRPHSDNFKDNIARGFCTELGTISVPTAETVKKFIPEEDLWPVSDTWAYHDFHFGGWLSFDRFIDVLASAYGESDGVDDFCSKAQMYNYDAYRAIFEGFNSRMWNDASGVLLWMSHPAWPSFLWQTYTYDYETPAAYFGAKKACEKLHSQYNPETGVVQTVNTAGKDCRVRLQYILYSMSGDVLGRHVWKGEVSASSVVDCFSPDIVQTEEPVLMRLNLKDMSTGQVFVNEYWLPSADSGFTEFDRIGEPELEITGPSVYEEKDDVYYVTVKNVGNTPAIYIKLNARGTDGQPLLPALFSDGYFTLFPGESRQVSVDMSLVGSAGEWQVTADAH